MIKYFVLPATKRSINQKQKTKWTIKVLVPTILVEQSPAEIYEAINNPRTCWSGDIEGKTDKLNDEWKYHFGENHHCKMKTIEMIPDKKAVWLVEDNYFKFTKDQGEWTGNKITFEISKQGNKTQLVSLKLD